MDIQLELVQLASLNMTLPALDVGMELVQPEQSAPLAGLPLTVVLVQTSPPWQTNVPADTLPF